MGKRNSSLVFSAYGPHYTVALQPQWTWISARDNKIQISHWKQNNWNIFKIMQNELYFNEVTWLQPIKLSKLSETIY